MKRIQWTEVIYWMLNRSAYHKNAYMNIFRPNTVLLILPFPLLPSPFPLSFAFAFVFPSPSLPFPFPFPLPLPFSSPFLFQFPFLFIFFNFNFSFFSKSAFSQQQSKINWVTYLSKVMIVFRGAYHPCQLCLKCIFLPPNFSLQVFNYVTIVLK